MNWNYIIIKEQEKYYLAEVFYKKLKWNRIKYNKIPFYYIIYEWKNREDILKKIKNKNIDCKYNDEDYLFMKKDLWFFKKCIKLKE